MALHDLRDNTRDVDTISDIHAGGVVNTDDSALGSSTTQ